MLTRENQKQLPLSVKPELLVPMTCAQPYLMQSKVPDEWIQLRKVALVCPFRGQHGQQCMFRSDEGVGRPPYR